MSADPYSEIIRLMRERPNDGEPTCKLEVGIVRGTSPLIVSAFGLENDEDDIVLVQTGSEAPVLTVGSSVLLLTTDYQKFYLLGRLI